MNLRRIGKISVPTLALALIVLGIAVRNQVPEYVDTLLALALTLYAAGVLTTIYLKIKFADLRTKQAARQSEIAITSKVTELSVEERTVLHGYVFAFLERAERKKLIYQTWFNVLTILTGVLSVVATLTNEELVQRTGSGTAAISTLLVACFSVAENAVTHRRNAYMISALLYKWVSGAGIFQEDSSLRRLVQEVEVILDSVETSFVGAGGPQNVPARDPRDLPTNPIDVAIALPTNSPAIALPTNSIPAGIKPDQVAIPEFISEPMARRSEVVDTPPNLDSWLEFSQSAEDDDGITQV
jgi:hypothetical protein